MRGAGPAVPSTEHLRLPAAPRTQPAALTASGASSPGEARSFCTQTGTLGAPEPLRSLPTDWAHPEKSPAPPAGRARPRLRQGTRPRPSHMAERRCPGAGRLRAGGGTDGQPQPERPRPARRGSAERGRAGQRGEPRERPRLCPSGPGCARRRRSVPPAAGGCTERLRAPSPGGSPAPPPDLSWWITETKREAACSRRLGAVTCRLRRHTALPTAPARRAQLPELQGGLQESTRKETVSLAYYFLHFTSRLMASLIHQHQRTMIFHRHLLPLVFHTGAVWLRAIKYNWPHFLKPFTCPKTCPTFIRRLPG